MEKWYRHWSLKGSFCRKSKRRDRGTVQLKVRDAISNIIWCTDKSYTDLSFIWARTVYQRGKAYQFFWYAYKLILYVLGITFEKQAILEKRIEEEKELLNRISDSELYIAEPINDKPLWCGINFISRFVSFARYYIYSMRDDEDSHSADINFLRVKNNYSISTGLRLCSWESA